MVTSRSLWPWRKSARRTGRSQTDLASSQELKSDNVEEMSRRILESNLVRKLEVPDSHLYFQAPGGKYLRLGGIDEDLSF
jgi:hypothetical protein